MCNNMWFRRHCRKWALVRLSKDRFSRHFFFGSGIWLVLKNLPRDSYEFNVECHAIDSMFQIMVRKRQNNEIEEQKDRCKKSIHINSVIVWKRARVKANNERALTTTAKMVKSTDCAENIKGLTIEVFQPKANNSFFTGSGALSLSRNREAPFV